MQQEFSQGGIPHSERGELMKRFFASAAVVGIAMTAAATFAAGPALAKGKPPPKGLSGVIDLDHAVGTECTGTLTIGYNSNTPIDRLESVNVGSGNPDP